MLRAHGATDGLLLGGRVLLMDAKTGKAGLRTTARSGAGGINLSNALPRRRLHAPRLLAGRAPRPDVFLIPGTSGSIQIASRARRAMNQAVSPRVERDRGRIGRGLTCLLGAFRIPSRLRVLPILLLLRPDPRDNARRRHRRYHLLKDSGAPLLRHPCSGRPGSFSHHHDGGSTRRLGPRTFLYLGNIGDGGRMAAFRQRPEQEQPCQVFS